MSKLLRIRNKRLFLRDEISILFEKRIVKVGNGAMCLVPKKYLGRKALVVVLK